MEPSSLELSHVAPGLHEEAPGLYRARDAERVSYPRGGHAFTHGVEADSFWFRHRTACILAAVERHPPPGALFDVGGGTGHVVAALRAAGHEAVLVEPGPEGARLAWQRGLRPVVNATTTAAGFLPRSLAAVGLFDVVEHVEDDHAFVGHLADLLRPGGTAYLTVPAHQWLWSVDDVRAGHYRRYDRRGLRTLLEARGFDVAFLTALFRPLPLPVLAVRSIPGRLGLRGVEDRAAGARDHRAGGGRVGRVLDRVLAPEVERIARGRPMAVGSSLLAVARRR